MPAKINYTDAEILEITKCQNVFIFLIPIQVLLLVTFILASSDVIGTSLANAIDTPMLVAYILVSIVTVVFIYRLVRASRKYWICLLTPLAITPAFSIIGLLLLWGRAARAMGQEPGRVPKQFEVRHCMCGGVMFVSAWHQWVAVSHGRAPFGYVLVYRCQKCSKQISIPDNVVLMFLLLVAGLSPFILWAAIYGFSRDGFNDFHPGNILLLIFGVATFCITLYIRKIIRIRRSHPTTIS